ncbi:uncharacterized protein LOC134270857 [Saccostrea cucullata]|uniref:uncharacterized protein LOC134270857 n=1 Tax=Saccostrea cuccullata TaxID=36930 RepID=UPI002ED54F8E
MIREVFLAASIKGCVFHFTQAVWWKTQELGHKTTYSQREAGYRYIRMLMVLQFLSSTNTEPAFQRLSQRLSQRATSTELRNLVGYTENTWLNNPVWRSGNWSIYRQSIRTNNDVEGYHTWINADMGRGNKSYIEVIIVELTHQLVNEEQIFRNQ